MRSVETKDIPIRIKEHERYGHVVKEILGNASGDGYAIEVIDIEYDGISLRQRGIIPKDWRIERRNRDVMIADTQRRMVVYGDHYIENTHYTVPSDQELPEPVDSDDFMRRVDAETRMVFESKSIPQVLRVGFFTSLGHEFGHGHVYEKMSDEDKQLSVRARSLVHKDISEFTSEDHDLYNRFITKNEADSWEWILSTLEQLRREGINLTPEFPTEKELISGAQGAMATYEKGISTEAWLRAYDAARHKLPTPNS